MLEMSATLTRPSKSAGRTAVSIAWMIALALATFLPLPWKIKLGTNGPLHLWLHFAVFGAAGYLAFRSARSGVWRLVYCVALMSIAMLQETVEARMGGNRMEWLDIAVDFAGLLLALLPSVWDLRPVRALNPTIIRRVTQVWLAVLILGSLQPARPKPVVSMHLGIHLLGFGGAVFLLLLLADNLLREIRAVVGMCLLGLTVELLQHLMYGNVMEWWDVRDDALAILTAWALYRLVWKVRPETTLGRGSGAFPGQEV
jgi:hypothetical protein